MAVIHGEVQKSDIQYNLDLIKSQFNIDSKWTRKNFVRFSTGKRIKGTHDKLLTASSNYYNKLRRENGITHQKMIMDKPSMAAIPRSWGKALKIIREHLNAPNVALFVYPEYHGGMGWHLNGEHNGNGGVKHDIRIGSRNGGMSLQVLVHEVYHATGLKHYHNKKHTYGYKGQDSLSESTEVEIFGRSGTKLHYPLEVPQ